MSVQLQQQRLQCGDDSVGDFSRIFVKRGDGVQNAILSFRSDFYAQGPRVSFKVLHHPCLIWHE